MMVGYVLTAPEQEQQAGEALVSEMRRMAVEAPGTEEFERARNRLLGNMVIALQSNSARVGRCATDVLYGRAPTLPTTWRKSAPSRRRRYATRRHGISARRIGSK